MPESTPGARSPRERFERFPEPLQEALVELALSIIDSTEDEKATLYSLLEERGGLAGSGAPSTPVPAYVTVVDAVSLQVQIGQARRAVQGFTQQILSAGGALKGGQHE